MKPDLPDLDADEHQVRTGRRFGYTIVGDWVLLNPDLSDRAVRIYCLLRMHCQGAEERAKPAQTTLAEMLGIKKTDGIGKAIKELVGIGAVSVEVTKHRAGRRNTYVVHEAPPPAYDQGPVDRSDFYAKRKQRREIELAAEGVPPDSGVTPILGVMGDPRSRGDGSPPRRGSEAVQGEEVLGGAALEDQNLKGSADAPSTQAPTVIDPWLLPSLDTEPLPPPSYLTEPDEWIDHKAGGLQSNERNCMEAMLNDGQEPMKVLNTILKQRDGIYAGDRSAIRGKWLPFVKHKVGGWRRGEYDYARKLLADYHQDIVVEELLCQREGQLAA